MAEFLSALAAHEFLQRAMLAGVLASIGCGIMGTYVVVKRITFLAGGIAHAVLGGMGAAIFFSFSPLVGAMIAAIAAALIVGWVSLAWKERQDTVIGAIWATGMAAGILFISRTPGYNVDLMSYLFGNILMVTRSDLWLMAALDLVILAFLLLFYKQVLAVSFDEQFARVRGVRVKTFYLLLLCLVALTVVLLIQVVGLILVIALLTLPAAVAGQLTGTFRRIMLFAVILGGLFTSGGLALSYGPDLPTGSTTILLAGITYLLVAGGKAALRRLSSKSPLV